MENSTPKFDFEQGYNQLKEKLKHEQLVNERLTDSFQKAYADREDLKESLAALQLKCQDLEKQVSSLTKAEKAREKAARKSKAADEKTSESLRKIGLTEDILLALPFGYSTKVRSAYEKLSYENDKLKQKIENMQLEEVKKFEAEKEELLKNIELVKAEKTATEEAMEEIKGQLKQLAEKNHWLLSIVAALGKEVVDLPNTNPRRDQESLTALKLRCKLLSKINTSQV